MVRVTQTTGCWFLGKCLGRLEVRRQMATWCTDSPMRLHSQQEIHLWDGSPRVMPQIWVWWRTQEPRASNGDSQPSLKGFLRTPDVPCIESDSAVGLLERCLIGLYAVHREIHIQPKYFELLCQCSRTTRQHKKRLKIITKGIELNHTIIFQYYANKT